MRTLEYMLENWESMEPESKQQIRFERFFRSATRCRFEHPPIRYIGGECALCKIASNKKHNEIKKAIKEPRKPREAEMQEKERTKILIEERVKAQESRNRCDTLDKIKTGVLYFVKGRCSA